MDVVDSYLMDLRQSLDLWNVEGVKGRDDLVHLERPSSDPSHKAIFALGCLTLELLRIQKISISKLTTEATHV